MCPTVNLYMEHIGGRSALEEGNVIHIPLCHLIFVVFFNFFTSLYRIRPVLHLKCGNGAVTLLSVHTRMNEVCNF